MKLFKYLFLIAAITSMTIGCNSNTEVTVSHSGALMEIMSGKIKSTISLKSIEDTNNLYALGAMEDLQGEIQVFNGEVLISSVKDTLVSITNSWDTNAALLVYSNVKEWEEFEIPNEVRTKANLELFVRNTATAMGFTSEQAFPFLIEGTPESLDWHVIQWEVNDAVHTHEKHQNSGLRGKLGNTQVTLLGFYSELHKGVFTHHTTNMHLHFKTNDELLAGHLDDLELAPGMKLKLPLGNFSYD